MKRCPNCKIEKSAQEFYATKSNGGLSTYCKPCQKMRARKWQKSHPDQEKERKQSPHTKDVAAARYHLRRDKGLVDTQNYRAKRLGVKGKISHSEWALRKAQYGNRCSCCGQLEPQVLIGIDHIVPISMGGTNTIENCQPMCLSCNAAKGNTTANYSLRATFMSGSILRRFLNVK